jgi:hypothetical protein
MGRLAARIAALEQYLPVPLFVSLMPALILDAADAVGLNPALTARLMETVRARHAALVLPQVVHVDQAAVILAPVISVIQEAIRAHVPVDQQYAYAKALSDRMMAAARRSDAQGEEH